jgi:predicted chitinase
MKKLLLFTFTLFLCTTVQAQVGVGTPLPNNSAQLDVVSNDKGLLIPRIPLTSATDATTITEGNIVSLLVFNTATVGNLTPGYHYWDGFKWQRMINSDDFMLLENLTSLIDNNNGTITYTDEDGVSNVIDIAAMVTNFETLTSIRDNGNGTITYIDENGSPTVLNIAMIISQYETVTTLVNNGDGTVTYTSEDGTATTFDITQSGTGSPITNTTVGVAGDIYVDETTGDVWTFDGTTWVQQSGVSDSLVAANGTYTHTAVDGTVQTFDVTQSGTGNPITNTTVGVAGDVYVDESTGDVWTYDGTTWVQQTGNEVVTTLVQADGTYTYTSEDGTATTFDVSQTGTGSPITNTTVGVAGDVYVDESTGDVWTYDGTTWVQQTGNEVVTTLVQADGT